MRKPGRIASTYLCFVAIVLLAFSLNVGCGDDDDDNNPTAPYISADWVGIWEVSSTVTVCEGGSTPIVATDTLTICPDEEDWVPEEDPHEDRSYNWDGNTMSSTWSRIDTTDECIKTTIRSYTGTVTGTSYNITGTMRTTYSGTGCPTDGIDCLDIVMSGTRIGDAPDPCDPFDTDPPAGPDVLTYTLTNGGSTNYGISDNESLVILDGEGRYTIIAGTVDGHTISFFTPAATAANNYGLAAWTETAVNQVGADYIKSDGLTRITTAAGTMLITEADANHIAGSFSYTATLSDGTTTEDVTVSDGEFDLLVDSAGKTDQIPASAKAFRARLLGMIR